MTQTDFLKACEAGAEKTGRPEWEESNCRMHLEGLIVYGTDPKFFWDRGTTDHEAACLWAEHLRVWLIKREFFVYAIPHDVWLSMGNSRGTATELLVDDKPVHYMGIYKARPFVDTLCYYSALIAARDALEVSK